MSGFVPAAAQQVPANANTALLFCAYGSTNFIRRGDESQFAVAVVEVNSQTPSKNVSVSNLELLSQAGTVTQMKRVISVEEFDAPPRDEKDGQFAYYIHNTETRPWNGMLPAGTIRLRIRVSLDKDPRAELGRCRVTISEYKIEGPVSGTWAT